MHAAQVMETLAHHTENPTDWIELINKIDGLIRLAAFHAIGELADVPYVQDEASTHPERSPSSLTPLAHAPLKEQRAPSSYLSCCKPHVLSVPQKALVSALIFCLCVRSTQVGTLAMQLKSSGGGTNSISTTSQMTSILLVLVKLFESMRQCMTGGYIISQLQHKYSAATRNNLRREWGEYHAELVGEVSE